MFKKIIFSLIFSQCLLLGVFWATTDTYYVVEKEKNLCWEFTRWDAASPNWLPKWWEAVFLDDALDTEFFSDINCEQWNSQLVVKIEDLDMPESLLEYPMYQMREPELSFWHLKNNQCKEF